ncbi:MAG: hypothetical protein LBV68_05355 [Spirochaetaceae bacterium]|nr:hypothetical protein [Spirochaetaceae bacterium]
MKLKACFLFYFLLSSVVLFAQEQADDEKVIFYIRNIDFDISGKGITGKTKQFALLHNGEFKEGERIIGKTALEKYIEDKTQLLINQRVLESVKIIYVLGEIEEDQTPVDLLVTTVDSNNFLVLPEPKFSSSSGFDVELKLRDYNFLGTMSPLRFDIGYSLDEDELWNWSKGSFNFVIDSDTPFTLFGYKWNFNFDHDFSYTFGEPLYYKNVTGISMNLPFRRTTFTAGFDENIVFNERNATMHQAEFGRYAFFYMSSELYASWKIPFGISIGKSGGFGELTYTPKLSGKIKYSPRGLDEIRRGFVLTMSHTLGFGRINWIENYRNGIEASIDNTNAFNFYRKDWDINWSISGAAHKYIRNFFGISGRVRLKQWFFTNSFLGGRYPAYAEVGDVLRGIIDDDIIAENAGVMLSMSLDIPIRILHFVPSEWFHSRKLRYINFDLHFSPFMDIAFLYGHKNVSWKNGLIESSEKSNFSPLISAGVEFIVFPLSWRSIYMRLSLGYNINKLIKTKNLPLYDEVFIGVGHQY